MGRDLVQTCEPCSAARASSVAIVSSGRASRLSGRLTTVECFGPIDQMIYEVGLDERSHHTALCSPIGQGSAKWIVAPPPCQRNRSAALAS